MNHTTFDMISIGDTTEDIFLQLSDASVQCDLDGGNCKICFDYADKIAVEKKTDVPAVGNAANHAIGIARLDLRVALFTIVGDDTQGHIAHDVLHDEGVNTGYVKFDKHHGTNFSAVINYRGERTILTYHEPRDYTLPDFSSTKWVYLTSSSGDGIKTLHDETMQWLRENKEVRLAFNPGTHQINLGKGELRPVLARTEVLFLNRQESADLLEMETTNVKKLINGFHEMGVKIMVLTDGADGSYVSDGKDIRKLDIFQGPVIERTGAGDSFGVGFMGAMISGKPLEEAMLWGNANATSVVQFIGAREGLLSIKQIENMIETNSKVKPRII